MLLAAAAAFSSRPLCRKSIQNQKKERKRREEKRKRREEREKREKERERERREREREKIVVLSLIGASGTLTKALTKQTKPKQKPTW